MAPQRPEEIRAEIQDTRGDLAADVDRLADHTSPKRIAERRLDRVRSTLRRAGDRVMGSSQEAGRSVTETIGTAADRVQGTAHDLADKAGQAPAAVTRQAQGNPIAVGLIAFGAGLLAASLFPQTKPERRMGEQLAEQGEAVIEPLKETGRQLTEDLRGTVQEAAGEVKETATQAVGRTKEQAAGSGREAVEQTRQSVR